MSLAIYEKYAKLLVQYCVNLQEGQKLWVQSSTLAEPLVKEIYREALKSGGIVFCSMDFKDQQQIFMEEASHHALSYVDPIYAEAMENFDAYIFVRAPFASGSSVNHFPEKSKLYQEARLKYAKSYSARTASLAMKRNLCEFPTEAHAKNAGLTLEEYAQFIYHSCGLFEEDPIQRWKKQHDFQKGIVSYLNQADQIHYKSEKIDLKFSTKGRIWINSDGKTNMPSGEVYSAPIEDSVEGVIHFDIPSMYQGQEVEGITLWIQNGQVEKWEAKKGKELLDRIFQIPGARYFGEVAIGTNYQIQKPVRNILFDEKIGGTVHLAIGQTYYQCGGKNESSIHWDMIADMTQGGEIFADGEKIYQNGNFLIV